MRQKIFLIKIAAIGDIVITCRVISDYFKNKTDSSVDLYWVIDHKLQSLAAKLFLIARIPENIHIHWIPVSSQHLFQGNIFQKTYQTLRIAFKLLKINPHITLILHRDQRYRKIFSLFTRNPLLLMPRIELQSLAPDSSHHEMFFIKEFVEKNLQKYWNHSMQTNQQTLNIDTDTYKNFSDLGILIGGAHNQKLIFNEKKWPHFNELILKILQNQNEKIKNVRVHLFGGPMDVDLAKKLIHELSTAVDNSTIQNRVINHVNKHELDELPEIFSNLKFFIGIDSGLSHLAAFVMNADQQKVITLFGPTDPTHWRPISTNNRAQVLYNKQTCAPCYKETGVFKPCIFTDHEFQKCMKSISADMVLQELTTD